MKSLIEIVRQVRRESENFEFFRLEPISFGQRPRLTDSVGFWQQIFGMTGCSIYSDTKTGLKFDNLAVITWGSYADTN